MVVSPLISHPTVDLSALNFQESDQELPVLALPALHTLFSKPCTALSLFPSGRLKEDYFPSNNLRDFRADFADLIDAGLSLNLGPVPKKPHSTIKSEEGVVGPSLSLSLSLSIDKTPNGEVKNHWIKKRLTVSDVDFSSRLLVPKDEIIKHVLPLMDVKKCGACQSSYGGKVKIWDLDTNSEHHLSLKKWTTGSFVLTSNWITEFVNRRNLQEGDIIFLCWEFGNQRFLFHKL